MVLVMGCWLDQLPICLQAAFSSHSELPAITVQLLARKPEEGAPSGADGSSTLESAGRGWAIKNNLVWEQKASITAVSSTLDLDEGRELSGSSWKQERNRHHIQSSPLSNGLKYVVNLIGKLCWTAPQRFFSLVMSFSEVGESYLPYSIYLKLPKIIGLHLQK